MVKKDCQEMLKTLDKIGKKVTRADKLTGKRKEFGTIEDDVSIIIGDNKYVIVGC